MIGRCKNNKLTECKVCGSTNIEHIDHSFDLEDTMVTITYDVSCMDCENSFEIIDIFTYEYSIRK